MGWSPCLIDALQLADIDVDYVSTKDDDLKRALKHACDVVVAGGGDGTIGYVFTHLADRSIPIGILPLGSANNIARSLGIAETPAELAEQWRAPDTCSPFIWLKSLMAWTKVSCARKDLVSVLWRL
jgi:diacylglycerol kinase family enzyme